MRLALAAALILTTATPALAQDGAALFNAQCKTCHALVGDTSRVGPTLKGVYGRKIATAPGYSFSAGLKKKDGVWTEAALDAYLAAPTGYAPGTRMFNRVAKPQERTALIAYLKAYK